MTVRRNYDLDCNWVFKARELGRSSSAFDAHVGFFPEIPALVIDAHRCYFLGRKRNFLVSSNFDNAAFAGDNLVEAPAVSELD